MKYYTENKEMYFEVQGGLNGYNVGYQVASYHKIDGTYRFERMLPEDYMLDLKEDAEQLAAILPMIYDWGYDDSQYVVKDNVKAKLLEALNQI